MKRLLFILLLFPLLSTGQYIVTKSNKALSMPYCIIPNSASQFTMGTGTYTTVGTGENAYINCSVAGTAYIKSSQAYGEWYFDLYKGNTANTSVISIIDNTTNPTTGDGYRIEIGSTEDISLIENNVGTKNATAAAYISNTIWYKYKVTRSVTGVFTTYIKGGSFGGEWNLISVTSGTNPVTDNTTTTSAYLVLDLDATDRIRNIKFKPSTSCNHIMTEPYRVIPNNVAQWTAGTGTYVNGGVGSEAYIQCSVAGTAYIKSSQAYGEWRFDLYRGNTANIETVYFINTSSLPIPNANNSYYFDIESNEGIYCGRTNLGTTVGFFNSAPSYLLNSIWYSYKITRTATGIFTYYIKGGNFGNEWNLITSISGTNPTTNNTYTTSNYFVLDLDATDRIRNIKFKPL